MEWVTTKKLEWFGSDLDIVVHFSQKFEGLLVDNYEAKGKGLHGQISSIEAQLSTELVRKLRKVATIRNKVVHEKDYKLTKRESFIAHCQETELELLAAIKEKNRWCLIQ